MSDPHLNAPSKFKTYTIVRTVSQNPLGSWKYVVTKSESHMKSIQFFLRRVCRPVVGYSIGCALSLSVPSAAGAYMVQGPSGIRLAMKIGPQFVLHEPVYATLTIHNSLNEEIRFDLGQNDRSSLGLSIVLPTGGEIAAPAPPQTGPAGGIFTASRPILAPGETYVQQLLLNEWHEFGAPGQYRLKLWSTARYVRHVKGIELRSTEGGDPFFTAEEIGIEILPEDAGRLQSVCTNLMTRAISSPSVQMRVDAAVALSYVNDPAAIPFLRQILFEPAGAADSVRRYAVDGLARIRNIDAIEILLASLPTADSELTPYIRRQLRRVESLVEDQALKARIQAALLP